MKDGRDIRFRRLANREDRLDIAMNDLAGDFVNNAEAGVVPKKLPDAHSC